MTNVDHASSPAPHSNAAASATAAPLPGNESPAITLQLPLNVHGNIDVRKGLPSGVCFLPPSASPAELKLAGIPVAKGLTGISRGYKCFIPRFADALLAPIGWRDQFRRWRQTPDGAEALKRHRNKRRKEADAKFAKRSEAAQRGAASRRKKRELNATLLGKLLLSLLQAQQASDRAKARAANGCRRYDYYDRDRSVFAAANYLRSRQARERDYVQKEQALKRAVALASLCGISFGWGADEGGNAVVYFNLTTGQVSFHCTARFDGPDYTGSWDGIRGVSGQRIEDAIRAHLEKPTTLNG